MKRIMISAAKGGVGKTTVAVTLARELNRRGRSVGILDADIVAPNVPYLFGFNKHNRPRLVYKNDQIVPVEKDGIKIVSYWFELDENIPVLLWSTQRVDNILQAFCKEVNWGDVDILIIDCPPTTTDEIVGLAKSLGHIDGVVLVVQGTTRLSIEDAKLSMSAFEYLNIKVLGVVQNMVSKYFKEEGIDIEEELNLPVLAKIPLGDLDKIKDLADYIEKEVLE